MELKPCPFCGENEQQFREGDDGDYSVRCQYCGASGEWCSTKRMARECWNTRVATKEEE